MTAFIVQIAFLAEAESIAGGPEFSIPLGSGPEATHMGCNWVGCPDPIEAALSGVESMQIGRNFLSLCADLGLDQLLDETTPPG